MKPIKLRINSFNNTWRINLKIVKDFPIRFIVGKNITIELYYNFRWNNFAVIKKYNYGYIFRPYNMDNKQSSESYFSTLRDSLKIIISKEEHSKIQNIIDIYQKFQK